jgi:hypothetical protein
MRQDATAPNAPHDAVHAGKTPMPHPQDRFIFPDRAYAPGYEPAAPREDEPLPEPIMTRDDYLRFGAMAALIMAGLAAVSSLILPG